MRGLVVILGLLLTGPALAADQFDLICTGKQRVIPMGSWKPYQVRYRIDLSRMIYCRFECKTTETIAAADAARITFQVPEDNSPASYLSHYVDRSTGRWSYFLGGLTEAEGTCEPGPFSGFPTAKF